MSVTNKVINDLLKNNNLEWFVKEVFVIENIKENLPSVLPFYADGFPGVMYQKSTNGAVLLPSKKKLSDFFLYGQTIKPIEIEINSPFRLIVFQLFPFVPGMLFKINPKELNDDCFDLSNLKHGNAKKIIEILSNENNIEQQIVIISRYLRDMINTTISYKEQKIRLAIDLIFNSKGAIPVKSLTGNLHTTERSLQRMFIDYIGISPKQFARIIQFHSSKTQISGENYSKLTEVVYENGYSDQSHFIRSFKKFTGMKPSEFKHSK